MSLSIDTIKQNLQRHFSTGLVVIVGSGLSCAEGLPSMTTLAKHLANSDPTQCGISLSKNEWDNLISLIEQNGLEAALHQIQVDDQLADFIRAETARCISKPETAVINDALAGTKQLRLSRLLPHLPSSDRLPIITTNYDRLIELAAEIAEFQVDTKSTGFYHARFSANSGKFAFCSDVQIVKRVYRKVESKCISLYKPHGSLDWTQVNGQPIRTGFHIEPENVLMITPGQNKYRAGYDSPFDMQRELANKAIQNAAKILIIGYGFNDNHLEVHLSAKIKSGTPTLIMAYELTQNAKEFLNVGPSVYALERDPAHDVGTLIHAGKTTISIPGEAIWDVNDFVTEVLGG